MQNKLLTFILIICICAIKLSDAAPNKCPDLPSLRSEYVKNNLNYTKLSGFYYELSFQDIAQVGSTCQVYNNTWEASKRQMNQIFKVNYGILPFSLKVIFNEQQQPGYFLKHSTGPVPIITDIFEDLLDIPTVLVDILEDSEGNYLAQSWYSCVEKVGEVVEEIYIASSNKQLTPLLLKKMKDFLTAQGIDISNMKDSDQSKCKK